MTALENIAWFPRTEEPRSSQRNTWNNQVRNHAVMRGDQVALKYLDNTLTWARLADRVSAVAGALSERGVSFGDRVLVLGLNRLEYIEAVLAVTALGGIAVPVNFRMAPPEVAYLAQDTGCSAIVYEAPFDPLVAAASAAGAEFGLRIRFDGADEAAGALAYEDLVAEGRTAPVVDVPEDSPALIMYTSGTTGRPKGAVLTHVNMTAQGFNNLIAPGTVDTEAVGAVAVPLFHIAGFGVLATAFIAGTTSVIFPLGAFDPAHTLDVLEREGITTMFMVPVQWQLAVAEQQARPRDLKLKYVWWGAAPASETLLRALVDTFPDATICAVFGQTEMSPVTCALSGEDTLRKLGSVGKVVRTVAARVVDPEGKDVPRGEVGEIVYRGPNMMAGYWNNVDATRAAFDGGWFHSGDLVRMDDEGFVYITDRAKDMIISGGENIYSVEVENAVAAHPAVVEVAVIGRPDEKWGEAVVAVVSVRDGEELSVESLSEFLNDHIARYKHPRDLVVVPELPRNPAGKITKPALRQQFG
ncbi:long-chain-fatty-acid--CoA ligase [Tsukamurella pseudospumae]|uniref:Long-chain fatty acid--CoA ligase n=1 Tax=Tsukamurella pseudospumae TaxID=239498 RepID=A0A137ZDA7_9ACTN|nr:long-chain-fatty-acid--CoA ligase [Tsukamurella pseudospumae]KXO96154.1 long-chain fatty acid--CoA ligase [Tsukamurella pseudospumae]